MVKIESRGLLAARIGSVILALSLLYFTFHRVDFSHVGRSVARVGVIGFALIATPQLLSLCLECIGWSGVFRLLGRKTAPLTLLRVRLATEALAQTLPLGVIWAEALKPLLLGRHAGLGASDSVAGIVARKYLLMASQAVYVALLSACGFATLRQLAASLLGHAELAWGAFAIGGFLALLAFGVSGAFTKGRIADRVLGLLRGLPHRGLRRALGQRQAAFTRTDDLTARYFASGFVRTTLMPGVFFLCGWLCESLESFLILRLLGVQLGFFTIAAVEVMLSFLKNVLFVLPAGIGVQDVGYVSCFAALGVADPLNMGAAFSLLKRGKELFWALVGYALLASEARSAIPTPELAAQSLGVDPA
ncbi:MAG TPA: lysylphosphatidylglycerol synthase transmembrane domain-containing protein [Polyangiaceae bacterium]|nr:lysylphosphatidylglycerol synthase transmembrane domain-containing protein [Polyangiaceae bacterium]